MTLARRSIFVFVAIACVLVSVAATASDIPLRNWAAPAYWSPSSGSGGGRTPLIVSTDVSGPLPFVPVVPCRVGDTRPASGYQGAGSPMLALATRAFTIGGLCGIPTGATAVSFEFTATNETAAGNFRAWPQGYSMPTASVLNWGASTGNIGNGIVVPVGGSPATLEVYLNGASGTQTDLVLDVNGYYAVSATNQ